MCVCGVCFQFCVCVGFVVGFVYVCVFLGVSEVHSQVHRSRSGAPDKLQVFRHLLTGYLHEFDTYL